MSRNPNPRKVEKWDQKVYYGAAFKIPGMTYGDVVKVYLDRRELIDLGKHAKEMGGRVHLFFGRRRRVGPQGQTHEMWVMVKKGEYKWREEDMFLRGPRQPAVRDGNGRIIMREVR